MNHVHTWHRVSPLSQGLWPHAPWYGCDCGEITPWTTLYARTAQELAAAFKLAGDEAVDVEARLRRFFDDIGHDKTAEGTLQAGGQGG